MPIPTDRWTDGGWNSKLAQIDRLARIVGVDKDTYTLDDVQGLFPIIGNQKVFGENVQQFIEASTGRKKPTAELLDALERKLGTCEPLPFMSLEGESNPADFEGVAIWPAGTANWTQLRLEQIEMAFHAGANFKQIICLNSSRTCNSKADRRHPLISSFAVGDEPTEYQLQGELIDESYLGQQLRHLFKFARLPEVTADAKPLTLEQQLRHLQTSGQYDQLIDDADIYVPSTPNSLYVPLHVRRILGHENVWFSQAGARVVQRIGDYWWPAIQDVMTLPNGILRLWVELLHAGCITA